MLYYSIWPEVRKILRKNTTALGEIDPQFLRFWQVESSKEYV